METEYGREDLVNQINTRVHMLTIKNVGTEYLPGRAEMYTKANILMM